MMVNLFHLVAFAALCFVASARLIDHEAPHVIDGRLAKKSAIPGDTIIGVKIALTQSNLEYGHDHLMKIASPASTHYGQHWTKEEVISNFAPSVETVDRVKQWLKASGIDDHVQSKDRGWLSFNAPANQIEAILSTELYAYEDLEKGATKLGCGQYTIPDHLAADIDYLVPTRQLSPHQLTTHSLNRRTTDISQERRLQKRSESGQSTAATPEWAVPSSWIPPSLWTPPDHWYGGSAPSENAAVSDEAVESDQSGAASSGDDAAQLSECDQKITPACIRALYGIPVPSPDWNIQPGSIGLYESVDVYAQGDLDAFFENYAPYIPSGTHPTLQSINGATAPGQLGGLNQVTGESDVDFDLVYSLLGPIDVTLYQDQMPVSLNPTVVSSENDYNSASDWGSFLDAIDSSFCDAEELASGFECQQNPLTTVLSISYGGAELGFISAAAQRRVCNEFLKLVLQGHTILVASGDSGVSARSVSNAESPCSSNGCLGDSSLVNGTIFQPSFPASCPYVLAVGGTILPSGSNVSEAEFAMTMPNAPEQCAPWDQAFFGSGGGFSNYFARSGWQDDAVSNYFASFDPGYPYYESNLYDLMDNRTSIGQAGGIYSRSGRAIPDVSANGANLAIFVNGTAQTEFGTSLAAPIWASLIAMLNSERATIGKGPVGFINPILYENPSVFNDIEDGQNPGCGTQGFSAAPGWDPVTGLGTPNYPRLWDLFLNLP